MNIRPFLLATAAALGLWATAQPAQAAVPAVERAWLVALYNNTGGGSWSNNGNWDVASGSTSDPCVDGWYGITCNDDGTHVTGINLGANGLNGSLPAGLNQFTALEEFRIGLNHWVSGQFPNLDGMGSLRSFHVQNNRLEGPIPSLAELVNLREFNVMVNRLTGPIPPELGSLSQLRSVWFDSNELTGPIPDLSGLSQLITFYAQDNQLTGSIPDLSGLPELNFFGVSANRLTGTIPALPADLRILQVTGNQLTGTVPIPPPLFAGQSRLCHWLAPISEYEGNYLTHSADSAVNDAWNAATGQTDWAAQCTPAPTYSATYSVVGGNGSVTADTPQSGVPGHVVGLTLTPAAGHAAQVDSDTCGGTLSGASYTTAPLIADCAVAFSFAFTGGVPAAERDWLVQFHASTNGAGWNSDANWLNGDPCLNDWHGIHCNADDTHVIGIVLGSANLVGSIPAGMHAALTQLERLELPDNRLSGAIPALAGLTALRWVELTNNVFDGAIPALTGLTALEYFLVPDNALTGTIPALDGLSSLRDFIAHNNQLSGSIPALDDLAALRHFEASWNQLSGPIPALLALTELRWFSVGNNALVGSIPPLEGLTRLQYFDVSQNALSDAIPALTDLADLEEFFAYDNALGGPIPDLSALVQLVEFDVSNNQLSGPIPASLSLLPNLHQFRAANNDLGGPIPALPPELSALRVEGNRLTGPVPGAPASLVVNRSRLCGPGNPVTGITNYLVHSADPATNAAWNEATNLADWAADCLPEPITHTVTPSVVGGNGSVAPDTPQVAAAGAEVAFTLTPAAGHVGRVDSDSCGGTLTGTVYQTAALAADCAVVFSFATSPVPALPAEEVDWLVRLYHATGGASAWDQNTRWLVGDPCFDAWYGIHCNADGTHVIGIVLRGNNLDGELPPGLNQLTALEFFILETNQLRGPIPELSGLAGLLEFSVYDNQLTGAFPDLAGLDRLEWLALSDNQLSGPVSALPASLEVVWLSGNGFTGPVPAAPAQLSPGISRLCSPPAPDGRTNFLAASADGATNTAWNTATGLADWATDCTPVPAPITQVSGTTVPPQGAGGPASASFTGGGPTCGFDLSQTGFIAAPAAPPAGQQLPQGMFRFRLLDCDTTPVAMAITWPQTVEGYAKYGNASAGAPAPSYFAPQGLHIDGQTVHFTIVDGQQGDDDWTVNGTIVDPSGPLEAVPAAASDGVCGSANGPASGLLLTSAPSADLCSAGAASVVTGDVGAWAWSCSGSAGGTDAACQAPRGYTVTPEVEGAGGSIDPAAPQTVAAGGIVRIALQPQDGAVPELGANTCGGAIEGMAYTTAAATAHCRVVVRFVPPGAGPQPGQTAVPVPALGQLGLLLMGAALAVAAAMRLRRRPFPDPQR